MPHNFETDSMRRERERSERAHPYSGRGVTAVLGPTNTGKTHLAIERMTAHPTGMIGLPLRLLAREVYTRLVERVGEGAVALITGEEKIQPPNARYSVCTVEAMPRVTSVSFVAIDEVQLAGDLSRGHVFTDRILHLRGANETLLLGAGTMRGILTKLLPGLTIVTRPRLSHLAYSGSKKITRLPRRTAIVAFSADEVYAIAELIRRQRGGAAVVLGALSPRTRNAQVELFQHGDVDFLVATDAIGMGLNLDLDHVAFAQDHKFDGFQTRPLSPAEMGQIAGRAGRHVRDGTFGVTGTVPPLDDELVTRIEGHEFEPVKTLQWRSPQFDFASLDALQRSVEAPPDIKGLARALPAHDVRALEILAREDAVQKLANTPRRVALLWEACALPDYRRIAPAQHAELIEAMFKDLARLGHVDETFMADQVSRADRIDGEIDTLSARIAQIRTWTFVSHRPNWLRDPAHWQGVTREVEDRLSDALHERLTRRFVDRRTSVLMRRLRENAVMEAEIGVDGDVHVEGHAVGTLEGFRFRADASAGGADAKAVAAASARALGLEFEARAARLAASPVRDFALGTDAKLRWQGQIVGQLAAGDDPLRPRVILLADEQLTGPARDKVAARLERHVRNQIETHLKPLLDLTAEPSKPKPAPVVAARVETKGAGDAVRGELPRGGETQPDAAGGDDAPYGPEGQIERDGQTSEADRRATWRTDDERAAERGEAGTPDGIAPDRPTMEDGSHPTRTDGAAAEGAGAPQPDGAATVPPDGSGGADGVMVADAPIEAPVMEGAEPTPATMPSPADPGAMDAPPAPDANTNEAFETGVADTTGDAASASETAAPDENVPVDLDDASAVTDGSIAGDVAAADGPADEGPDGGKRKRRRRRRKSGVKPEGADDTPAGEAAPVADAVATLQSAPPPREGADGALTGMARGLAFRLAEAFGTLPRREVADEVRSLDQAARAGLRKRGVRFGFYHIFVPALLKPGPAELATLLWALRNDKLDAPGYGEIVPALASGRTSIVVDPTYNKEFYRLAGFRVMGGRAVRIDILERLADLIRPAVQWTPGKGKRPEAGYDGNRFITTPGMMSILGAKEDDLIVILKALGYRAEPVPASEVEAKLTEIDGPKREGPEGIAIERKKRKGRKDLAVNEGSAANGVGDAATTDRPVGDVAGTATDSETVAGATLEEIATNASDSVADAAESAVELAQDTVSAMAGAVIDAVVPRSADASDTGEEDKAGEGATNVDAVAAVPRVDGVEPTSSDAEKPTANESIAQVGEDTAQARSGSDAPETGSDSGQAASAAGDGPAEVVPEEEPTVLLWRQGPPPGARQRGRGASRDGEGRGQRERGQRRDGGKPDAKRDGRPNEKRSDGRGRPGERGRGDGPDRNDRPNRNDKRGPRREDRAPRPNDRGPRRERQADPDSPFAVLAALKGGKKK